VGDATYGSKTAMPVGIEVVDKFSRQALHSWRMAFRQPRTGRELAIEAPMPADMASLAAAIGLSA